MAEEPIYLASKIRLECGCGATWAISGLLASSDLTGFTGSWTSSGHDHDHGKVEVEELETRPVPVEPA